MRSIHDALQELTYLRGKPQGSAQWPVMDRQVGDGASFIARNDCNASHADAPEGARLPLKVLAASIDRLIRDCSNSNWMITR
jgi:hypothetical protein